MSRNRWLEIAAAALAGAMAVAGSAQAAPYSNGGSQYWVGFDPNGRNIGPVQFMTRRIVIVNTSNQTNSVSVYYEPKHALLCTTSLGPGQTNTCSTPSNPADFSMVGGYYQVIAEQPVLVGGQSDTAFMNFAQQLPQQNFGADPAHGVIISVMLQFQPGCPPRPGNGCPNGSPIDPSTLNGQRFREQFRTGPGQ